jgi:hypothetical protein
VPLWPLVSGGVFATTLLGTINQMYFICRQNVTFSAFIKIIYYIRAKVSSDDEYFTSPKQVKLDIA